MKTTIDTYPVFDANQVLTDDHLNAVVNYLEEQDRLTRANLVGVGISCGLNATIDRAAGVVGIVKGCAVTSLGYLLTEPESMKLTGYRAYGLPIGDAYAPFVNRSLLELFPDGEPGVTVLSSQPDFLKDKSVVLFLERDTEDLSDCSPSNCDDKGLEVTVTLRCLLVDNKVVEEITKKLRNDVDISARLDLPDLRLHRFDTPRAGQGPVTTRDVLEDFQAIVKTDRMVTKVGEALDKVYTAFQPVLQQDYPSNPFGGFKDAYRSLELDSVTPQQVTFMPYYMDFFSDLLAAYDEFRRRGLEYNCVCCPPEDWFPRHVVLGPQYRTGWYPSAAACCGCESLRSEIVMLFRRLVEIVIRFNNNPPLRPASPISRVDPQIRVTPSRSGLASLSARCIPYYYDFKSSTPLYELWNPELTQRKRSH
jgi:hypothetical protein